MITINPISLLIASLMLAVIVVLFLVAVAEVLKRVKNTAEFYQKESEAFRRAETFSEGVAIARQDTINSLRNEIEWLRKLKGAPDA